MLANYFFQILFFLFLVSRNLTINFAVTCQTNIRNQSIIAKMHCIRNGTHHNSLKPQQGSVTHMKILNDINRNEVVRGIK